MINTKITQNIDEDTRLAVLMIKKIAYNVSETPKIRLEKIRSIMKQTQALHDALQLFEREEIDDIVQEIASKN